MQFLKGEGLPYFGWVGVVIASVGITGRSWGEGGEPDNSYASSAAGATPLTDILFNCGN